MATHGFVLRRAAAVNIRRGPLAVANRDRARGPAERGLRHGCCAARTRAATGCRSAASSCRESTDVPADRHGTRPGYPAHTVNRRRLPGVYTDAVPRRR